MNYKVTNVFLVQWLLIFVFLHSQKLKALLRLSLCHKKVIVSEHLNWMSWHIIFYLNMVKVWILRRLNLLNCLLQNGLADCCNMLRMIITCVIDYFKWKSVNRNSKKSSWKGRILLYNSTKTVCPKLRCLIYLRSEKSWGLGRRMMRVCWPEQSSSWFGSCL